MNAARFTLNYAAISVVSLLSMFIMLMPSVRPDGVGIDTNQLLMYDALRGGNFGRQSESRKSLIEDMGMISRGCTLTQVCLMNLKDLIIFTLT